LVINNHQRKAALARSIQGVGQGRYIAFGHGRPGNTPGPPPFCGGPLGIGVDQGHLFTAHGGVNGKMCRQGCLSRATLLGNEAK